MLVYQRVTPNHPEILQNIPSCAPPPLQTPLPAPQWRSIWPRPLRWLRGLPRPWIHRKFWTSPGGRFLHVWHFLPEIEVKLGDLTFFHDLRSNFLLQDGIAMARKQRATTMLSSQTLCIARWKVPKPPSSISVLCLCLLCCCCCCWWWWWPSGRLTYLWTITILVRKIIINHLEKGGFCYTTTGYILYHILSYCSLSMSMFAVLRLFTQIHHVLIIIYAFIAYELPSSNKVWRWTIPPA